MYLAIPAGSYLHLRPPTCHQHIPTQVPVCQVRLLFTYLQYIYLYYTCQDVPCCPSKLPRLWRKPWSHCLEGSPEEEKWTFLRCQGFLNAWSGTLRDSTSMINLLRGLGVLHLPPGVAALQMDEEGFSMRLWWIPQCLHLVDNLVEAICVGL